MSKQVFDPEILKFATPGAKRVLKEYLRTGSKRQAADAFDISTETVSRYLRTAKKHATMRGFSPEHDMHHIVPDTHYVKGTSTLYDADGNITQQWVKSNISAELMAEALRGFTDELAVTVKGKFKPVKPPKGKEFLSETATHYKIGDQHLGMYAWGEETGDEDYDLKIATEDILGGLDFLIGSAPRTSIGVIVNVGDFLHANDRKGQTPASGNNLDVDGRHGKVYRRAAHILKTAVRLALRRHEEVHVINARGNHDPDAAIALEMVLEAYFESEPRVKVFRNDTKVIAWEFGDVLTLTTHGEKNRRHQYEYLSKAFRQEIGRTKYLYVDNGHTHHKQREEIGAATFEVWNCLPPADQYHADSMYGASRSITSVTYHRKYGEVGRNVCDLRMIRDLQAKELVA